MPSPHRGHIDVEGFSKQTLIHDQAARLNLVFGDIRSEGLLQDFIRRIEDFNIHLLCGFHYLIESTHRARGLIESSHRARGYDRGLPVGGRGGRRDGRFRGWVHHWRHLA